MRGACALRGKAHLRRGSLGRVLPRFCSTIIPLPDTFPYTRIQDHLFYGSCASSKEEEHGQNVEIMFSDIMYILHHNTNHFFLYFTHWLKQNNDEKLANRIFTPFPCINIFRVSF